MICMNCEKIRVEAPALVAFNPKRTEAWVDAWCMSGAPTLNQSQDYHPLAVHGNQIQTTPSIAYTCKKYDAKEPSIATIRLLRSALIRGPHRCLDCEGWSDRYEYPICMFSAWGLNASAEYLALKAPKQLPPNGYIFHTVACLHYKTKQDVIPNQDSMSGIEPTSLYGVAW